MASLTRVKSKSTKKNPVDSYTIQVFVAVDGVRKRRSIRLGPVSKKIASEIRVKVAALEAAAYSRTSWDSETAGWIGKIDPKLYDKIAHVGLAPKRAAVIDAEKLAPALLGPFLDSYIAGRAKVKPSTAEIYKQVRRGLIARFGVDKPLVDVTQADAEDWQQWLATEDRDGDKVTRKALGPNTVSKRCSVARQFFARAVKERLIAENPFAELERLAVRANRERDHFLTREDASKVLDACPDAEWRLIFALSRYAGLRCPSEHLALRWADVNFATGRMIVRSPKTEHHEGKGVRVVPIFPELLTYLEDAREVAEMGAEFVIGRRRSARTNFRTQLERIIEKAGLKPWPKLFQNLRATRQTELADLYPAHVVCAWIGNSQAVAAKHYLQVTDDHFDQAIGEAVHGAVQSPADTSRQEKSPASPILENLEECDMSSEFASALVLPVGLEPTTY